MLHKVWHKRNYLVACGLCVLTLSGCTTPKPPVTAGIGTTTMADSADYANHLKIDNAELARHLHITDIKSRQSNGLKEVNVELSSRYKKSLKLQYHFNWFDAQGFVVERGKSPWKPLELHGQQSTTISGLAPTSKATSFNVYVREIPEKAYKY